jgi:molybdopterin synthase catalytic subunit
MTEKALEAIVAEAKGRFDILDALVIHRVGTLAQRTRSYLSW